MSLNDLSVSKKLTIGFAGVVSILLVMCIAVFMSLVSVRGATNDNAESHTELATEAAALDALVEQQNAVRGFVSSGSDSFVATVDKQGQAFEAALQALAKLPLDSDERAALASLKDEAADIRNQEDSQIATARNPATRAQAQASIASTGRLTKARAIIKSLSDPESARLTVREQIQARGFNAVNLTLLVGGLVSVLASIVLGLWLTRAIAAPVSAMTSAMGRLAAGDNTVEIPAVGRKDEVGHMADAVQSFKEAALEKLRLEAAAAEQQRAAQAAERTTEAERAAAAAEQSAVVR